jgi:hypothetical protein
MQKVPLDENRIDRAVEFYKWTGAGNSFPWARKDSLVLVGTYLTHHFALPYWDVILEGGARGYSLFLHELVEVKWYRDQGYDELNAAVQISHYSEAHSFGLLAEHRFLQLVGRTMGHSFTLRQLMVGNPHGDPPQRDWDDVWTHRRAELTEADAAPHQSDQADVQEFYRRLGFRTLI